MHYPEGLTCRTLGCEARTQERKPHCSLHVHELPYVASLIQTLEARDKEVARVAKRGWRAVDVGALTASEVLLQLELYGERTAPRLCRDLQLELDVAEGYAQALARAGLVRLGQTERGHMKLSLASPVARSSTERNEPGEGASVARPVAGETRRRLSAQLLNAS